MGEVDHSLEAEDSRFPVRLVNSERDSLYMREPGTGDDFCHRCVPLTYFLFGRHLSSTILGVDHALCHVGSGFDV